jgi:hypothetical protein
LLLFPSFFANFLFLFDSNSNNFYSFSPLLFSSLHYSSLLFITTADDLNHLTAELFFFLSSFIYLSTNPTTTAPTDDLKHLTAVRMQQHQKFADENNMASFAMSAKNNDHVNQTFWKVELSSNSYSFCILLRFVFHSSTFYSPFCSILLHCSKQRPR